MAAVVYLDQTDFREQMLLLRSRGGPFQKAYDKACKVIESLRLGASIDNYLTNHGESRIKHAVKYDIGHACRLVTIQTENYIYLLFAGIHEEADRWLDKNRGLVVTADSKTREVIVTHITDDQQRRPPHLAESQLTEANVPFLKRIPDFNLEEFVDQSFLRKQLLKLNENSPDDEIEEVVGFVADGKAETGNLLFDLICEVRASNIEGATARLQTFRGSAVPVTQDPRLEATSVSDVANSERLLNLSELSPEDVKRFFSPGGFRDWMLFLNPEQKRVAEADYDRPTVLTGISGSGKTVILVHRARYLARKYPNERIGVVTLSRSLSRLIANQLDELCKPSNRKDIHVFAFYDLFKELIDGFGPQAFLSQLIQIAKGHPHEVEIAQTIGSVRPDKFAREYDPLSREELGDTWELFIDQPAVQTLLTYFRDHLENHQFNIDVEAYLQEEFSLIRSAFATSSRVTQYLEMERMGRAIPFPPEVRVRVLQMLLLFEETMLHGGVLDALSLTAALLPHVLQIRALPPQQRFRCLLVDEFQDFSTLDLSILRRLPVDVNTNGLFLTGDPVQRVLVKDLRLGAVGLDILSANRIKISKNYRNSRQILEAANLLSQEYGSKAREQGEEIELLDPEFAVRETARPIASRVNEGSEIAAAWQLARECLDGQSAAPWSVTITTACPNYIDTYSIIAGKPQDFAVKVDTLSGDYVEHKDTITVANFAELKGFEFSLVIIVGCSADELPAAGRYKGEAWRDALRLYVAMTRARDSVYLLYTGKPSEFLNVMKKKLDWHDDTLPSKTKGTRSRK